MTGMGIKKVDIEMFVFWQKETTTKGKERSTSVGKSITVIPASLKG